MEDQSVIEPSFQYFKIFVLISIYGIFVLGAYAQTVTSARERLTFFEKVVFFTVSFAFFGFPFCHVVYEAFLSSSDPFVWFAAIVPPLAAGYTSKTQMDSFKGL